MLDDLKVVAQRDSFDALGVAATQWEQVLYNPEVEYPDHDGRRIERVVVAGMGGSALAASIAKNWLETEVPLQIELVRNYKLPNYVDRHTLVICSSYSGNTEEVLSCLEEAKSRGAQIGITAAGGVLLDKARNLQIACTVMPSGLQPRMALFYNLRALLKLMVHFKVLDLKYYDQVAESADWLKEESRRWLSEVTMDHNVAKQLALMSVGKTPIFYTSHMMSPVAYKWKISWNENAKNLAFWNELPEFNHNEFMGWVSHPIEKPFAIFDLISNFEDERILKRFEVTDRLLSGRRPKSHIVSLQGSSPVAQMLWGCVLADFTSIYVAILNGVDPTPVTLIERFKKELK
ncbi:bifunctional phosphoglucose/phosphomannose isomerase [Candidatus Saccharibacteria bacterium]|jgi:glucose/mannose-6-phosphate isomerase|nr:bifunctional phosphoglucose/phosphomannose isomerase [Candidatus Saccharibacteria bacterium]